MAETEIHLEFEDDLAILTMDGPKTLNALSAKAARALSVSLDQASRRARALLLKGAGNAFCSGADLVCEPEPHWIDANGQLDSAFSLQEVYNPLISRLKECGIPIVTAVKGAAAGFGCGLALMGDIIVAGKSAYFMQAFAGRGLVPDGNATYILTRIIGKSRTMEMTMLGDKIQAQTALDWGMINRLVPDEQVDATALEFARQLANGPYSLGSTRKLVWQSLDQDWYGQAQNESLAQRDAVYSEDFTEGVMAFQEKRKPDFKGR